MVALSRYPGTGFYHYVPYFDENGELKETKEKLTTIPSYQELLNLLGLAQIKSKITPEIFTSEVFNTIIRAHALDKNEVDPELILLVVRQLYEYFIDSKEYTSRYPFTVLDGYPDRKQEVRRALETYSWNEVNHTEIAMTFRYLVKRAFQGKKALLNQYLTPLEIINFMVELVQPSVDDSVLDFECGSGGFLSAVLSLHQAHQNITGIEINKLPYYVAKTFIAIHQNIQGKEVELIPIILGNGLLDMNKKHNIIISNPAGGNIYDPEKELGDIDQVINALSNDIDNDGSEDRGYSEYYFSIQRAITSAKFDGRICLVLPEGVFANQTNHKLRDYISRYTHVQAIVSLPRHVFSKGTTTKRIKPGGKSSGQKFSILLCKRNHLKVGDMNADVNIDYSVFLASIEERGNLENKLSAIFEQYKSWLSMGKLINNVKIEKPIPVIKNKPHQPALVELEYPLFSAHKNKGVKLKQTITTTIADSLKSLFE